MAIRKKSIFLLLILMVQPMYPTSWPQFDLKEAASYVVEKAKEDPKEAALIAGVVILGLGVIGRSIYRYHATQKRKQKIACTIISLI